MRPPNGTRRQSGNRKDSPPHRPWSTLHLGRQDLKGPSIRLTSRSVEACADHFGLIAANLLLSGSTRIRLEIHRNTINAVTLVGWRRPVIEDMAQMASTPATMHLSADHAVAAILRSFNRPGNRAVEAWPTCAAVEFLCRFEQNLTTAHTNKGARPLLDVQSAAVGCFSAVSSHDAVLLGRQETPPFLISMRDRKVLH